MFRYSVITQLRLETHASEPHNPGVLILDLDQFISKERPFWDELLSMLKTLEDQPERKMSLPEARRFHYLYQRASSDLVKLQTFAGEVEASQFLENLVARAYGRLHEKQSSSIRFKPREWIVMIFPNAFRRHWKAFLLSVSFFLSGCFFGAGMMAVAPQHKMSFLGGFTHLAGKPSERVAEEEKEKFDNFEGRHRFSAYLMQHNIRVTILVMVLGFAFGIFTVILLFRNGIILGIVAFDYITDGEGQFLTAWLLPHGSVEIPAILLGGQAGLIIAHAVFGWGTNLRMRQRFRRIRGDLLTIIGGAALLLVWAGIVESFLSQYHGAHIYPFKIWFGAIQLAGLFAYLLLSGNRKIFNSPPKKVE